MKKIRIPEPHEMLPPVKVNIQDLEAEIYNPNQTKPNTTMNNIKTQNTVVVDSSTIHLGKFGKNPSGKYLVIVKDYSDVCNVKTIDRFRCDAHQLCAGVAHWSKES